jgi:hypothetical protein
MNCSRNLLQCASIALALWHKLRLIFETEISLRVLSLNTYCVVQFIVKQIMDEW